MALPASGSISLSAVNTELGVSATAVRSLNDSTTRALFGVASGVISLSNGYNKANKFSFTISTNQINANLFTLAVAAGWNQSSSLGVTINSGVYVSSNSTSTPAFTVSGSFPGGVEIINNGIIVGMGGDGGKGSGSAGIQNPGGAGGTAISTTSAISVTNNGTIAGGGGGGGGGGQGFIRQQTGPSQFTNYYVSGGGGGGGQSSFAANSVGGVQGQHSGPGTGQTAGTAGTISSAGAGGAGAQGQTPAGAGGAGGAWGTAGSNGGNGYNGTFGVGGVGGAATSGNSNITWVVTGTRYGSIS